MNTERGRVISFDCEEHGRIWDAAVYCQHDIDAEMRAVADGHHKPYGAGCKSVLTVHLSDAETLEEEPVRCLHPPLQFAAADVEGVALAAKRLPEGSVLSEGDTE